MITHNWVFHNGATYSYTADDHLMLQDISVVALAYCDLTLLTPNKLYIKPKTFHNVNMSVVNSVFTIIYNPDKKEYVQLISSSAGLLEICIEPTLTVPFLVGRVEDSFPYMKHVVDKQFEEEVLKDV